MYRNALAVSHLIYADDILVMCRANSEKTFALKKCFKKYCDWSGQEINGGEIEHIFSKFTRKKDHLAIRKIIGFKKMARESIYLRNQLMFSQNKIKEFICLKDRVFLKLEGWSKHLLSKAGKATLIKSVIQAIPTYTMSTYRVPTGVGNDLDALVRKFWWESKPNADRFLALKGWKEICRPKKLGGLGFKRFKEINLSLLAKLGWRPRALTPFGPES